MVMLTMALTSANDRPRIADWHMNKAAAVIMRFDDSLESHAAFVIPQLNEYGFRATFMVNPGIGRYKNQIHIWEQEAPRMRHELGNHTMHHRGAATPEEADREIGAVSRLIWSLNPNKSKLLPFASGGGAVLWGGRTWESAGAEYSKLVSKYHLIDLYDGNHPYIAADSRNGYESVLASIRTTIKTNGCQTIVFHKIGDPNWMDRLKSVYRGYDLTFSRDSFTIVLDFLKNSRDLLWIAPLGDVWKYEMERKTAQLEVLSSNSVSVRLSLTVKTAPDLYDQELTLVVPNTDQRRVASVFQGTRPITSVSQQGAVILINVAPVSGAIEIRFQ